MWKLLLISILLMGVIFFLFAIGMVFKKNGKFPNTHVGGNRALAKQGVFCATTQDRMARKDQRHLLKENV